jgi:hypothetical protein
MERTDLRTEPPPGVASAAPAHGPVAAGRLAPAGTGRLAPGGGSPPGEDALAAERELLTWCLHQSALPPHRLATLGPDFLIISPPKTGSTWLAENLRCHPRVFVPEVKEVKYFSSHLNSLDLNWYLEHFTPAAGRLKGEATPSYALLPVSRIRLVRCLLPDVKLIFLMREPVSRAWSHAKHTYRFREANFPGCRAPFEAITEDQWGENFAHPWTRASGDYLAQLRRWLSVFPREQLYVGFYESLAADPEALLRDILAFLGVNPDVDLSSFRLGERVMPGLPGEPAPALARVLRQIHHGRTGELASFLREHFDLRLPAAWEAPGAAAGRDSEAAGPPPVPAGELDDRALTRLLEQEALAGGPRLVLGGYRGYDVVLYRGRCYALDRAVGWTGLGEMGEAEFRHHQEGGTCLVAPSLAEVKEEVDRQAFARTEARLRALERRLGEAVDALRRVEFDGIEALHKGLRKAEADAIQLYPLHFTLAHVLRKAWRRLRAWVRGSGSGGDAPAAHPAALLLAAAPGSGDPAAEVVEPGYLGYDLVSCGPKFFALHRDEAPFDLRRVRGNRYRRLFVGSSVEEVEAQVRQATHWRTRVWLLP